MAWDDDERERDRIRALQSVLGKPLIDTGPAAISSGVAPLPGGGAPPIAPPAPENAVAALPPSPLSGRMLAAGPQPIQTAGPLALPPPSMESYRPKPLTGWRKGVGLLGLGMQAFASPQAGQEAYQNLFVRPGEEGERRYQADLAQYNKEIGQKQQQEQLESTKTAQTAQAERDRAEAKKAGRSPVPENIDPRREGYKFATKPQEEGGLGLSPIEALSIIYPSAEKTPSDKKQAIDDWAKANKLDPTDPSVRDKARRILATRDRVDATAIPGGAPSLPGVTGDAALEGVDAATGGLVKALAEGRFAFPSGFALRSPYWQRLLGLVSQYDPSFEAASYKVREATRKDFTSGNAARNVRSLNTAIGHLDSLQQAAAELDNSPVQLWNLIANTGLTQVGDPRVTKFNNAANAVAGELATIFKSTSGTDQEIKGWREQISASQSPVQIDDGIAKVIELLASRMDALDSQYKAGMGPMQNFKLLNARSEGILKKMGAEYLIERNSVTSSTEAGGGGKPAGATHVVPGPDGKNHYTNAAGTVDLGVAP